MKNLREQGIERVGRPIKVLQYGEGNFLRAFVDYMIEVNCSPRVPFVRRKLTFCK